MNLYTVIIDNGAKWAEDYYEKVFGIFNSHEKAEAYAAYVVGEGREATIQNLWNADEYDFGRDDELGYRIEEVILNEGRF